MTAFIQRILAYQRVLIASVCVLFAISVMLPRLEVHYLSYLRIALVYAPMFSVLVYQADHLTQALAVRFRLGVRGQATIVIVLAGIYAIAGSGISGLAHALRAPHFISTAQGVRAHAFLVVYGMILVGIYLTLRLWLRKPTLALLLTILFSVVDLLIFMVVSTPYIGLIMHITQMVSVRVSVVVLSLAALLVGCACLMQVYLDERRDDVE